MIQDVNLHRYEVQKVWQRQPDGADLDPTRLHRVDDAPGDYEVRLRVVVAEGEVLQVIGDGCGSPDSKRDQCNAPPRSAEKVSDTGAEVVFQSPSTTPDHVLREKTRVVGRNTVYSVD